MCFSESLGCNQVVTVHVLFCFVFPAFREPGVSTCSGRTPWRRGAHPHPLCPQRSWAALSAWTPSQTAAHPWVPCFLFMAWLASHLITRSLVPRRKCRDVSRPFVVRCICIAYLLYLKPWWGFCHLRMKAWFISTRCISSNLRESIAFDLNLNCSFVCLRSSITKNIFFLFFITVCSL